MRKPSLNSESLCSKDLDRNLGKKCYLYQLSDLAKIWRTPNWFVLCSLTRISSPRFKLRLKCTLFKKFKIALPKENTHLFGTLLACEILTKPSEWNMRMRYVRSLTQSWVKLPQLHSIWIFCKQHQKQSWYIRCTLMPCKIFKMNKKRS